MKSQVCQQRFVHRRGSLLGKISIMVTKPGRNDPFTVAAGYLNADTLRS